VILNYRPINPHARIMTVDYLPATVNSQLF